MSILSPIDDDLALVYAPLLPVPFREWLLARGIKLIEVPGSEFDSMGCNVLALAPRKCLALAGNPLTRERLEAEGVEVREFVGREISLKVSIGADTRGTFNRMLRVSRVERSALSGVTSL